jgi:mRNA-degrading endonuclease HigB of HigAB toxin-antitoxin module
MGTYSAFPDDMSTAARTMTLVGASLLAEYAKRHPEAKQALAGLQALIREAAWSCPAEAQRQFSAITRPGTQGALTLEIEDMRLRVTLTMNYALALVRVLSVQQMG